MDQGKSLRRCHLLKLICGHSFSDLFLKTLPTEKSEQPDLHTTFQKSAERESREGWFSSHTYDFGRNIGPNFSQPTDMVPSIQPIACIRTPC